MERRRTKSNGRRPPTIVRPPSSHAARKNRNRNPNPRGNQRQRNHSRGETAMRLKVVAGVTTMAAMLYAAPARAQLNGENLLGDMGVQSGTQPAPGLYASFIYYRYGASSLK